MKGLGLLFIALGAIPILWGVALVIITVGIYEDGEYIGPHWMSAHTAMMVVGALAGVAGTLLFISGRETWRSGHGMALLLFLGALAPGFVFSWTGFSGFGGFFFGLFVVTPVVLFAVIYGAALVSLRRARRG